MAVTRGKGTVKTAVFNWASHHVALVLLYTMVCDWLIKLVPLSLSQLEVKLNWPIVTWSHAFCRAWRRFPVFTSSPDGELSGCVYWNWPLSAMTWIGFGFTASPSWKPLCSHKHYHISNSPSGHVTFLEVTGKIACNKRKKEQNKNKTKQFQCFPNPIFVTEDLLFHHFVVVSLQLTRVPVLFARVNIEPQFSG